MQVQAGRDTGEHLGLTSAERVGDGRQSRGSEQQFLCHKGAEGPARAGGGG